MITNAVAREYRRLRTIGWRASEAFRAANTRAAFDALDGDFVELRVEGDMDVYDDSYIHTWDTSPAQKEAEHEATRARVRDEGTYGIVGYYRTSKDEEWILVDSVWGFIGDDWKDSGYDVDVMAATLKQLARDTRPGVPSVACVDTFVPDP